MSEEVRRCPAASADPERECSSASGEVLVVDRMKSARRGCVVHAAVLYAAMETVTLRPGTNPDGVLAVIALVRSWRGKGEGDD